MNGENEWMNRTCQLKCALNEMLSFSPFSQFPTVFLNANLLLVHSGRTCALYRSSSFSVSECIVCVFVDITLKSIFIAEMPVKWKYSNCLYFYWLFYFVSIPQRNCDCRHSTEKEKSIEGFEFFGGRFALVRDDSMHYVNSPSFSIQNAWNSHLDVLFSSKMKPFFITLQKF